MPEAKFEQLTPEQAINRPRMCEDDGGHEVRVKEWPPRSRHPSSKRPPHLDTTCLRCGCHLSVYDPPQPGIRVIKPSAGPSPSDAKPIDRTAQRGG